MHAVLGLQPPKNNAAIVITVTADPLISSSMTRRRCRARSRSEIRVGTSASTGSVNNRAMSSSVLKLEFRYSPRPTSIEPETQAADWAGGDNQQPLHSVVRLLRQRRGIENLELFANLPAHQVLGQLGILTLLQQAHVRLAEGVVVPGQLDEL